MNGHRGFTIVELAITITIMVLLLTLTVVGLTNSQANARDAERQTDIANIAQSPETYYASGSATQTTGTGSYPPTELIGSGTDQTIIATLRNIDKKSLTAPDSTGVNGSAFSIVAATNATETPSNVMPTVGISTYVYQPLQANNTLCTSVAQECRRFNLYYLQEKVVTVQKVSSKNQ